MIGCIGSAIAWYPCCEQQSWRELLWRQLGVGIWQCRFLERQQVASNASAHAPAISTCCLQHQWWHRRETRCSGHARSVVTLFVSYWTISANRASIERMSEWLTETIGLVPSVQILTLTSENWTTNTTNSSFLLINSSHNACPVNPYLVKIKTLFIV